MKIYEKIGDKIIESNMDIINESKERCKNYCEYGEHILTNEIIVVMNKLRVKHKDNMSGDAILYKSEKHIKDRLREILKYTG